MNGRKRKALQVGAGLVVTGLFLAWVHHVGPVLALAVVAAGAVGNVLVRIAAGELPRG